MRRFLFVLALLGLAATVHAQPTQVAHFVMAYDLDGTSYTYCATTGQGGDAWGPAIKGDWPVTTSGSSTTITETTASSLPFAQLSVGDILFLKTSAGADAIRYITAKASGASITVDSAITLASAQPFQWKKVTCGTAVTSGWIDVSKWLYKKVSLQITQMDATSIDARWECRDNTLNTTPVNVYPGAVTATGTCPGGTVASNACNYTSATGASGGNYLGTDVEIDVPYAACRLGLKINTDDGVDTTTHAEIINAYVTVFK